MELIKCTVCDSDDVIFTQRQDAPELLSVTCCACGSHATVEPIDENTEGLDCNTCPLADHSMCEEICQSKRTLIDYIEGLEAELAKYRDAEKDGRLIVLPCKVGDMIYAIRWPISWCNGTHGHICSFPVEKCRHYRSGDCYKDYVATIIQKRFELVDYDFGKKRLATDIFLTRAEAEATLEGSEQHDA